MVNEIPLLTKVCATCGIEKPDTGFYKYKTTQKHKSGFLCSCKVCVRSKQRSYRAENLELYKKQSYIRYTSNKQKAVEYKGGKCLDCGGIFPNYVYDFHHLDPNEKDHSWSLGCSWRKVKEELDKCVMLCANCHRVRHWERDNVDLA